MKFILSIYRVSIFFLQNMGRIDKTMFCMAIAIPETQHHDPTTNYSKHSNQSRGNKEKDIS